jgi:ketosteroid isomerase-like protein
MTSKTSSTAETTDVINRFNEVFNAHDVDGIMALMTNDVVFENTSPAPDGERYEGAEAVRAFWERLFRASPKAHFETEDMFVADDRCLTRWRYTFVSRDGTEGHIRGVDIFTVRDGKVSEKLSYVKG